MIPGSGLNPGLKATFKPQAPQAVIFAKANKYTLANSTAWGLGYFSCLSFIKDFNLTKGEKIPNI
jgi:hypothetical protein